MAVDSSEDRGPQLEGVTITLAVLAVLAFSLRAYVRACMVRAFGWDDWLMAAATVSFILYTSCVLGGIRYGTGRRYADLTSDEIQRALQVSTLVNPIRSL